MAGLHHGIAHIAFYDPSPRNNETASVLFSKLDAEASSMLANGSLEPDRRTPFGNGFEPGKNSFIEAEAQDTAGALLDELLTWYNANKQVGVVVMGVGGGWVVHWTEPTGLNEPMSVTIQGPAAGRSDFTKFGMKREGGSPKIYRVTNLVSHLQEVSDSSAQDQVREFFFPIPGIELHLAVDATEVSDQNFSASGKTLKVEFIDADGSTVLSTATQSLSEGRTELKATTPASVHKVKVTVSSTNNTFTVDNLSVRTDGSFAYTAR